MATVLTSAPLLLIIFMGHGVAAGETQLPLLQFVQPTNGAVFSTTDEIPIVLHALATNDVFPNADVFANQSEIATVSYCCTLCPCPAPFPGLETTLQIPVPRDAGGPVTRTWQGWTNVQAGSYQLTARAVGENGTVVEATPVQISVLDLTLSTWSLRSQEQTAPTLRRGVAYGQGIFVVTADSNVLVSTNGETWVKILVSTNANLSNVTFLHGQFVALGKAIYTSADGIVWRRRSDLGASAVTYGRGVYVAVGPGRQIYTSNNLVNWTEFDVGGDTQFRDVTYGYGTFAAVGLRIFTISQSGPAVGLAELAWSRDGANWTELYGDNLAGRPSPLWGLTYGNGLFVAVGAYGKGDLTPSVQTIVTSADGINWTTQLDQPGPWLTGVTYGNGRFVAVGDAISLSTNGVSWRTTSAEPGPSVSHNERISYGHGSFVATGPLTGIYQSETLPADRSVPRFAANGFSLMLDQSQRVELEAPVDEALTIESSSDLVMWTVTTTFTNWNGVIELLLPKPSSSMQFYRAKSGG